MNSFAVADITPDRFATKVRRSLSKSELAKVMTFERKDNDFVIKFSKMGTSTIIYSVQEQGNRFVAQKAKEDISFAHGLFKDQVVRDLSELLKRLGAETA